MGILAICRACVESPYAIRPPKIICIANFAVMLRDFARVQMMPGRLSLPRPRCSFSEAIPTEDGLDVMLDTFLCRVGRDPVLHTPRWTVRSLPVVLGLALCLGLSSVAHGQATATASRAGDLQAGAGFALGSSNFDSIELGGSGETLHGFDLYSTFDFKAHFGAEGNFRQTRPTYGKSVYERTYEIGGRYVYPIRRFAPYGKLLYGRGVFNYPNNVANLAYNLYSLGAGADFHLTHNINLRVDYEHQHWFGFPLQPLQPNLVTLGAAYHFGGDGRCYLCANR